LLKKPLQYIKEYSLQINCDIIGVVIANALKQGQRIQYILVSIPIKGNVNA